MSARGPRGSLPRASRVSFVIFFFLLTAAILPPAAPFAQTVTVRDNLHREVEVPVPAQRILSLQPEITRIIVALGAGERLVGLDYFIRDNDHLFKIIFPAGEGLPVVSKPDESVNRELVVRLRPDVIFTSPTEQQVPDSIQRSLGIPVLALASMGRFEGLLEEIELAGKVTGRSERAAELTSYFRRKIAGVAEAVFPLDPGRRPRVYLAFWSSLIRTPVSYEPVDRAGGTNVADGLLPSYLGTIGAIINIEQIIRWDPDIILVQGSFLPKDRLVTVMGILEDSRLRSVKAVRDRRVYYTFGFWYWWEPASVLVETIYLAKLFHPAKFAAVDIETEGNAVFQHFYGTRNTFTALTKALDFNEWTVR
jgi:iron complex transport system substrate-binding protein